MAKQTYRWEPLDPQETLICFHDWSARLEPGEVITNSWAELDTGEPSGVTILNQAMIGNTQQVTITGGTVDTEAKLTLRVEIDGGAQVFDAGIRFLITQW